VMRSLMIANLVNRFRTLALVLGWTANFHNENWIDFNLQTSCATFTHCSTTVVVTPSYITLIIID
jgi:hypothetical protein